MAGRLVVGPDGEVFEVNSTDHVEEVGLYGQLAEIRQGLAAGRKPAAGALLGLPELDGDAWADIAGASAVSGAAPENDHRVAVARRPEALPVPRRAPVPVPAVLAAVPDRGMDGGLPGHRTITPRSRIGRVRPPRPGRAVLKLHDAGAPLGQEARTGGALPSTARGPQPPVRPSV